jgi:hypothetical protein
LSNQLKTRRLNFWISARSYRMHHHRSLICEGVSCASVTVNLRANDSHISAVLGPDQSTGIVGYGRSISEALHDLAERVSEKERDVET